LLGVEHGIRARVDCSFIKLMEIIMRNPIALAFLALTLICGFAIASGFIAEPAHATNFCPPNAPCLEE
jgi:hypothetical protein